MTVLSQTIGMLISRKSIRIELWRSIMLMIIRNPKIIICLSLLFPSFFFSCEGHPGYIEAITQSPNGKYFASCDNYGNRFIWDRNFNIIKKIPYFTGTVSGILFSSNNKYIISSSWDGKIDMSYIDGVKLKTFQAHSDSIWELKINKNMTMFATSSRDKLIKIWDINGKLLKQIDVSPEYASCLRFSSDGKYLFAGLSNGKIYLFNFLGKLNKIFEGHKDEIKDVIFNKKYTKIISSSIDKTIRIWDLNGELHKTIQSFAGTLALYKKDEFVSGSKDISFWNFDGKLLKVFKGHTDGVTSLIILEKENKMISGGFDKDIRIWDIKKGKCIKTIGLPWYEKNFRL
jgi:WD40 repeat protein